MMEIKELKKENYVLKAKPDYDYWANLSRGTLNKYKAQFGTNFNIIIYSEPDLKANYYIIPFNKLEGLFKDEFLAQDTIINEGSRRWNVSIANHIFIVTRCDEPPVNVKEYFNGNLFLPKPSIIADEEDESSFWEGKEFYILHKSKERDPDLSKTAKEQRLKSDSNLCCDVCGFSFAEKYGEHGNGFIEAHHTYPISQLKEETKTRIEDIALVCSNCHRMLHRRRPWLSMDELKNLLVK